MKNKFLLKITAIVLILIMLLANLSFAGTMETANFKASLEKTLNSDMTILFNGGSMTTSSLENDDTSWVIGESKIGIKIKLTDAENNQVVYKDFNLMNYNIENDVYAFDLDINGLKDFINFENNVSNDDEMLYFITLLSIAELSQSCFLATTDAVGQDLSLAYTYFAQQTNDLSKDNVDNGVFKLKVESNEDKKTITSATLSINASNLKSLNKSMVDMSNYYYVITEKEELSNCTVSNITNKTYTGSDIKPGLTVKYKGVELLKDVHYKLVYSNNKNPGKATVTIEGIGNFKGNIKKTFIILPGKVTGLKANNQKKDSIKLNWKKQDGVTGYKLYSYNYKKKKWEYVGKTSNNSYTVKKLKDGTVYKYRVRAYKNIDGKQYMGEYSSSLKTATQTKTPKISKITTKNKKATIKWKKVSGASKYQIYMSTSKNGKYSKIKTTSSSATSYTKAKLKKNKKYYFKIRSYKTVSGKNIYSSYSSIKSIKVK